MDKLAAKLDKLGMQNRGEDEDEEGSEGGYQGRELAAHEQARLVALEKLHDGEYMDLEREYERERCILEAKYVGLRAPMFEQRAKIIAGTVAVPPLEVEEGETPPPASEGEDKGISQFWLQTLMQSGIAQYITVEDQKVMESLTDVRAVYGEDFKSFTIHFSFADNEFFTNKELFKVYKLASSVFADEPVLQDTDSVEFSPIEWKAGKTVTEKEVKKVQKAKSGKNKGQKRTITTIQPQKSFFHWFAKPTDDDQDEDDEEDEEKENILFNDEDDYEIAHYLRSEVIPKAVTYFTGEAEDEDDDEGDYDDEDDEDDDEGDEDEDEEEEEEEPKGRGKGKSGKASKPSPPTGGFDFAKPPAPGEQPQDCKQN